MHPKLSAQAPTHTQVMLCVCVLSSAICARFKTRARFWINLYANIWQRQIPSKPKLPRPCTWVMPCLRLPLTVWPSSSRRRGGYLPRFQFSFQIWDLRELKPMEIALNIFRLRPERIANPKQNNENFCTLSQHSGEGRGSKWRGGGGGVSGYGHVKHEIQLCLEFELGQKWTPHSKCGAYASAVSWGEAKGE